MPRPPRRVQTWPPVSATPSSASTRFGKENSTLSFGTCSDGECSSNCGRFASRRSSVAASFPFYVISMQNLLRLERLPMHEEALESGLLEEVTGDDCIHFISQRWLSAEHPDPDGVKLQRLQSVCREIVEGDPSALFSSHDWESFSTGSSAAKTFHAVCSEVKTDTQHLHPDAFKDDVWNGFVWWDYVSVPQSKTELAMLQQSRAINSIPHFIERSAYFWVLVPEAVHSETKEVVGYEDWLSRGWCRLEDWGNFLSTRMAPPIIVTQSPQLKVLDAVDFLMIRSGIGGLAKHAACQGKFSCCEANHRQTLPNGRVVKLRCDKEYVGAVLKRMYESKLRHYENEGKCMLASLLRNSAFSVFAGSGLACPPADMQELLYDCSADSVHADCFGIPPLAWAATYGSVPLVQELLDAGARPEQSVSVLHCAAQHGSADVLRLLLENMDSEAVCRGSPLANITSLDRASKTGHEEACRLLLAARASPHCRRLDNGATPLHTAAECGHASVCRLLIEAGAEPESTDESRQTPLLRARSALTLFGSAAGKAECRELLAEGSVITRL